MISEALLAHSACCCPEEDYTFTALLRGSAVFHAPAPPPPQKSAEYVALMARLRREAEEREYDSLVGAPQTATATVPGSEDDDWRLVRSQVSMIFNVLLSVLATAAAVWKVAAAWDVAARLGVAFVAAIVVAVAEVALLWGYLSRIEEAGTRERAKGEAKGTTGVSWIVGLGGVVEKRAGETGVDG
jgi:energy-converting hydrogenase Eha subunit C